jgi:hypothetical protein
LIATFEGWIKVVGQGYIKASFVVGVGKPSGEVWNAYADLTARLGNAVQLHNSLQWIMEML